MEGTGYPVNRRRGTKTNFTSPSEYMNPKKKETPWQKKKAVPPSLNYKNKKYKPSNGTGVSY